MIAINRENSKNLWNYKLLDSVNVKILEKKMYEQKNEGIDLIYLIKCDEQLYIFGGNHKESYKKFEGFMTSEQEITNYKNNLIKLITDDIDFNNSIINKM